MSKSQRIIMLFDVPSRDDTRIDADALIRTNPDYVDEHDVLKALEKLGHRVSLFPVFDNLPKIVEHLSKNAYDLVFTMFETYDNERHLAHHLTALFEVMGIPYTGASPETLALCQDKGLTKKVLSFHGIDVPKFQVIKRRDNMTALDTMRYPAIIKPLGMDASEGITETSIVKNAKEARTRLAKLRKDYKTDAIVEEYIEGRELYVGILAGKKTSVFPPQELHFRKAPQRIPRILTYKAKWNETYRKKYGIDSGKAGKLSKKTQNDIVTLAKGVVEALGISGHARLDLRLSSEGRLVFIEANPNPAIKRNDDFPQGAKRAGLSYVDLIDSIVKNSIAA
jgi:D-alanine-D-alanine ligase